MTALSQAKKHLRGMGYSLPNVMASHIEEWRGWYNASNSFYESREVNESKRFIQIRKTIHPARWVCSNWASLLFNENTQLTADNEQANEWLQEYLKGAGFLAKGQALIESGFGMGTSAWSLRFGGLNEHELKSPDASVWIQRHDAEQIIPLTYDEDTLTDVAFISSCVIKGKEYAQLSLHQLMDTGYVISVMFFDSKGLKQTGREGIIETGTTTPMFGLIKPALDNFYDPLSPLGRSVFDDAVDCLRMVDMCWDNMFKDIYLGETIVFIDDTLLAMDENGKTLIPRERDQQIFRKIAGSAGDGTVSKSIETFQPDLRVADNIMAITEAIDKLSMRTGFGKGYLNASRISKTATEVIADNADLFNHLKTHQNQLETSLAGLGDALLWAASNVMGLGLGESTTTVTFADSIVDDSNVQRAQDMSDIGAGIMQPYEYRMKWYGEDEKTAQKMIQPTDSLI